MISGHYKLNLAVNDNCLLFLGLSHEGIFRISGNYKVVESLKATFDKGKVI